MTDSYKKKAQEQAEDIWTSYECDQGDSHLGHVRRAIESIAEAICAAFEEGQADSICGHCIERQNEKT